ncbi:MAG: hypothetical protein ACYCSN_09195 [Acidobacteriaceae bacterium]
MNSGPVLRDKTAKDGPLSPPLLLAVWAVGLVLGYGLIDFAMGTPFSDPMFAAAGPSTADRLRTDFYVSGTTLFTLGLLWSRCRTKTIFTSEKEMI